MSLVAYGSSDDSEASDTEDTGAVVVESAASTNGPESEASKSAVDSGPSEANVSLKQVREAEVEESTHDNISDSDDDAVSADQKEHTIENELRALPSPRGHSGSVLDESDVLEEEVKPKASEIADAPKPPSRKRQPVKITIPALPDSDDEDDSKPTKKKPKPSMPTGKFGLTALLPPPVHAPRKETNRILLPYSLGKKPKPSASISKPIAGPKQSPDSDKISKLQGLAEYGSDSDEETNDGDSVNFFSLDSAPKSDKGQTTVNDSSELPPINCSSDTAMGVPTVALPPAMSRTALHLPAPTKTDGDLATNVIPERIVDSSNCDSSADSSAVTSPSVDMDAPLTFKGGRSSQVSRHASSLSSSSSSSSGAAVAAGGDQAIYNMAYYEPYPEASDDKAFQQDEDFLRMQGKKQRGKEEIHIMDVNADDYTNPSDLSKYLSEETDEQSAHRKKDNQPTSTQKRKHQIQYLAFQAKERELELKNQWADSRQTKKQTQAKYGF